MTGSNVQETRKRNVFRSLELALWRFLTGSRGSRKMRRHIPGPRISERSTKLFGVLHASSAQLAEPRGKTCMDLPDWQVSCRPPPAARSARPAHALPGSNSRRQSGNTARRRGPEARVRSSAVMSNGAVSSWPGNSSTSSLAATSSATM